MIRIALTVSRASRMRACPTVATPVARVLSPAEEQVEARERATRNPAQAARPRWLPGPQEQRDPRPEALAVQEARVQVQALETAEWPEKAARVRPALERAGEANVMKGKPAAWSLTQRSRRSHRSARPERGGVPGFATTIATRARV